MNAEQNRQQPIVPAVPHLPARGVVVSLDQSKAVVLGAAYGDALGFRTEALDRQLIQELFGQQGIQELDPDGAYYSDDTQLSLAVARALVQMESLTVEHFMQQLGREFVAWLHDPTSRHMGTGCITGIRRFESGVSWREAGLPDSAGCGSAMRVAPLGLLLSEHTQLLMEFAAASSQITHGAQSAITATKLAAYAVAAGLHGRSPRAILADGLALTEQESPEVFAKLVVVDQALQSGRPESETFDALGAGWTGAEAIALSLYACALRPDSYVDTVRVAANHWGDSDTIASIAGGIQAARLGLGALPPHWLERIETPRLLLSTAEALHHAKLKFTLGQE